MSLLPQGMIFLFFLFFFFFESGDFYSNMHKLNIEFVMS